ncbi:hypothetical protein C4J81_15095 [Deltaproteobacteria bacterium Smac51]|nr:hypothetical protein C4J81_15095 [Deltaproteobacteria bacterium Smac51]
MMAHFTTSGKLFILRKTEAQTLAAVQAERGAGWTKIRSLCFLSLFLVTVLGLSACSVKPQPYTEGQLLTLAKVDQQALMEGVPGLSADGKLSLEEAIIRAIAFNLDHRLALSENILAESERVLAAVSMLPDLSANGYFYDRSNISASTSMSFRTRRESLEPSYSSEPGRQWGNLEFSWSILDCGLSYYQAKQQADRVLITMERRRRVINTIVKDVVAAYYRAYTSQKYMGRLTPLIREAEQALAMYKRIEREKAEPLQNVLENQRRLMNIIAQLKRIESDMKQAQVQLAALCNFPLRDKFTLTSKPFPLPEMRHSIEDLELMGLARRPELREERYQERVDIASIKQEILKMFPAVRLLASFNLDNNPYLVYDHWSEVGVQVSASLLKIAGTGPKGKKAAENRQELTQMRRLALSMATLVQINLSLHQYNLSISEWETAGELKLLEERLLRQVQQEVALEADGRLTLVQQKAQTINSALSYDMSRVGAYTALGNLYFSVGVGMADELPADATIDEIARAVESGLVMMASGSLPQLAVEEPVDDVEPPVVFKDGLNVNDRRAAVERNVRAK